MKTLKINTLSPLSKVFPDKIMGKELQKITVCKGQECSYQVALLGEGEYTVKVLSQISDRIKISRVGYVPSQLPAYAGANDADYITTEAGLFPDPLIPLKDDKITLESRKYLTLWLALDTKGLDEGTYGIELAIGEESSKISLEIKPYELPPQELLFTQWFHVDCIADVHGVELYSAEHWELIRKYMLLASEGGMNMILVPVLTPPLDTEVGTERPTTQLVDIERTKDGYAFGFDRLEKYIKTATECGISNFEINHMFTQWGAKNAPKVMAYENGEYKRIFGWETDAASEEYKAFLSALIPELISKLVSLGIEKDKIFFHVSDEPSKEQLEQYARVSAILSPLVSECNQIDALSNIEFYEKGLVKTPVVAINHLEPFIEHRVDPLWCYYCCAQNVDVPNRFFAMTSARNRIIGTLMYKYGIKGFLHWGYNFYYSQLSKRRDIDPFRETDAGGAFPSGDAFSVYPYGDEVIPSLRLRVFKNALDDMRFLSLCESKIGKSATLSLVNEAAGMDMSFKSYPKDEEFFDRLYALAFSALSGEKHEN